MREARVAQRRDHDGVSNDTAEASSSSLGLVVRAATLAVAVLLTGLGSVVPPGAATVAALTRVPVAADEMDATAVKVIDPPASRLTDAEMLPEPVGAGRAFRPRGVERRFGWPRFDILATAA
jgi:hypothetical protein